MTRHSKRKPAARREIGSLVRRLGLAALLIAAGIAAGCTRDNPHAGARVMVLGIDGGTWSMIEPMMAAGQLPHIKKLYDEGLHGILQSRPPSLSPVVWTTIFTGFDYRDHGVKDWKTSQSTNRRVSAIWEINGHSKRSSDIFNVPGTWPPEPVDGVMMSGFPLSGSTFAGNTGEVFTSAQLEAGDTTAAYRDNLGEIRSRVAGLAEGQWSPWFGGKLDKRPGFEGTMRALRLGPDKFYLTPLYRTDGGIVVSEPHDLRAKVSARIGEPYIPEGPGWSRWDEPDTPAFLYSHLKQVFDNQSRAALEYAPGNWDLFVYVMTLVDRVSHPYWAYSHADDFPNVDRDKAARYESAVADAYRASDEALGKILDGVRQDPTRDFFVVVVSDHGFASSRDRTKPLGAHDPDGIYLVWGPRIKPASGARAYIEDVTPTLLYLMDMPVGADMDGKPIAEVTVDLGRAVDTVATHERGTRRGSDTPVDDATWEQLRGLGYVDGAPPRQKQPQQQSGARAPQSGAGQGRPPGMNPAAPSKPSARPKQAELSKQAEPSTPGAPSKPAAPSKPSARSGAQPGTPAERATPPRATTAPGAAEAPSGR